MTSQDKLYKEKLPWQQVLSLSSANFSQAVMLTMPFTIGVFMVRDFLAARHGGREEVDEQVVGRMTGLLAGIFSFSSFLTAYGWGCASNYIGRKPVIVIGNTVSFVSMLWFGLSGSYGTAMSARAFGGFFNGILGAWKCMIGESTDVLLQGTFFGYMSLAWGLGCIAGPALGGAFSQPCHRLPHLALCGEGQLLRTRPYFLACAVGSLTILAALILSVMLLEDTLPQAMRDQGLAAAALRWRRRRRHRERRRLLKNLQQHPQHLQHQPDPERDSDSDSSYDSELDAGTCRDLRPPKLEVHRGQGDDGDDDDIDARGAGLISSWWRGWRGPPPPPPLPKKAAAPAAATDADASLEVAVGDGAGLTERVELLPGNTQRSDDWSPAAAALTRAAFPPPACSSQCHHHHHHHHRRRRDSTAASTDGGQPSDDRPMAARRPCCPHSAASITTDSDMSDTADTIASEAESHYQQQQHSYRCRRDASGSGCGGGKSPSQMGLQAVLRLASRTYIGVNPFSKSFGRRRPRGSFGSETTLLLSSPAANSSIAAAAAGTGIELQSGCSRDCGGSLSQNSCDAVRDMNLGMGRSGDGDGHKVLRGLGRNEGTGFARIVGGSSGGYGEQLKGDVEVGTSSARAANGSVAGGGGGDAGDGCRKGEEGEERASLIPRCGCGGPCRPFADPPPTGSLLPPTGGRPSSPEAAEPLAAATTTCTAALGRNPGFSPEQEPGLGPQLRPKPAQGQGQCYGARCEAHLHTHMPGGCHSRVEAGGVGCVCGCGCGYELQPRNGAGESGDGSGGGGGGGGGVDRNNICQDHADGADDVPAAAVVAAAVVHHDGGPLTLPRAIAHNLQGPLPTSSNSLGFSGGCSSDNDERGLSNCCCACSCGDGGGDGGGGGYGNGRALAPLPEDTCLHGSTAFWSASGGGGSGSDGSEGVQEGTSKQAAGPVGLSGTGGDEPSRSGGSDDVKSRSRGEAEVEPMTVVVAAEDDGRKQHLLPWFRYPQVVLTITGYGATALIFCAIDEVFPIFAAAPRASGGLGMREEQIAPPLMFFGAVLMPYSLYGYPLLQRRVGTLLLTRVGLLVSVVACLMLPLVANLWTASVVFAQVFLYVAMVVKAFAQCSAFTGSIIAVNAAPAPEQLGAVNGVGQTLAALVRGVGPALGGLLWAVSLGLHSAGQQFLTFGLIAAVATANFWLYGFVRLPNMR